MTTIESTNSEQLSLGSLIFRLGIIGATMVIILGLFAYVGGWLTPDKPSPTSVIDAFEQANGPHPGFRRNHAKGVCVRGIFESNGQGAGLSRSSVFQPGKVSVIGRFAMAGGMPYGVDAPKTVRSMALLLSLPDGEEWRLGMNNIPVFPVNTGRGFYEQLQASLPDPITGKSDPAKMKAFLDQHPETVAAKKLIGSRPISSGFENTTYNSLNAFLFVDANGVTTPVRWAMEPVQPFEVAGPADGQPDKNHLFDGFIAAVHKHPLQWRLVVTVAAPEDQTSDPTLPWPVDRQRIEVGMLTIDQVESEDTSPARDINFDPLVLPDGITGSDDPILSARSATYSQSFTRRESEPKEASAVSPAEAQN